MCLFGPTLLSLVYNILPVYIFCFFFSTVLPIFYWKFFPVKSKTRTLILIHTVKPYKDMQKKGYFFCDYLVSNTDPMTQCLNHSVKNQSKFWEILPLFSWTIALCSCVLGIIWLTILKFAGIYSYKVKEISNLMNKLFKFLNQHLILLTDFWIYLIYK